MSDIFVEIFPRFILSVGRVSLENYVKPVFVAHSIKINTLYMSYPPHNDFRAARNLPNSQKTGPTLNPTVLY